MNDLTDFKITGRWILSCRGSKNAVDPFKPYAWLAEKEFTSSGRTEDVGVIFLTNRECPFRCLMCDLWKNTTDVPVPPGAIPAQIEWALEKMPGIKHIKLYNNGSFFDRRAITERDYKKIAGLLNGFKTVIVESHPSFINNRCLRFGDILKPELQVALGLETVNPEILKKLNKKMSAQDFRRSVQFLKNNSIQSRAFILLKPPFLSESDAIHWAQKSIEFAFEAGVECCVVIPVRAGNGAMDVLAEKGFFSPPGIRSLEEVIEYGINLHAGRIFADTWDLQPLHGCHLCKEKRIKRLTDMNYSQKVQSRVNCSCE